MISPVTSKLTPAWPLVWPLAGVDSSTGPDLHATSLATPATPVIDDEPSQARPNIFWDLRWCDRSCCYYPKAGFERKMEPYVDVWGLAQSTPLSGSLRSTTRKSMKPKPPAVMLGVLLAKRTRALDAPSHSESDKEYRGDVVYVLVLWDHRKLSSPEALRAYERHL